MTASESAGYIFVLSKGSVLGKFRGGRNISDLKIVPSAAKDNLEVKRLKPR